MATVSKNLQKKIMEFMNDGQSRDIPKIKEDLARKKDFVYGKDYGEGHLAGVLRVLASNGELEKVERGVYRRNQAWRPPLVSLPISPKDGCSRVQVFTGEKPLERSFTGEKPLERSFTGEAPLEQPFTGEASLEQIWQEALRALEGQYQSLVARMDAVAMSSLTPGDLETVKGLSELKEELRSLLIRQGVRI